MNCIIIRDWHRIGCHRDDENQLFPSCAGGESHVWLMREKGRELVRAVIRPSKLDSWRYEVRYNSTPPNVQEWYELRANGFTHWAHYYPLSLKDHEEAAEELEFIFGEGDDE